MNLAGPSTHQTILEPFPRSQHRSSFILPVNPIILVPTKSVKRWNFKRVRWEDYTKLVKTKKNGKSHPIHRQTLTQHIRPSASYSLNQQRRLLHKAAINNTSRDGTMNATSNITHLCKLRKKQKHPTKPQIYYPAWKRNEKKRWDEIVKNIDFIHSSRMACKTFN